MRFALCLCLAIAFGAIEPLSAQTKVSLLKGSLTFAIPANFQKTPDKGALGNYAAKDGDEWMSVTLASKPLPHNDLEAWLLRKRAAYSAGLPPEIRSHLRWIKQKTVMIEGKRWADLRFDCVPDGPDGANRACLYTRFLATTIDGHLLEIVLSSNLTSDAKRKTALDKIADSVKLKP
ncbi:hypothetical protein BH09VER1_BH09VER1_40010 [soil metagenome]